MSNHGYIWWRNTLEIDQQALLAKIESPMLIVQGGMDESASPLEATAMVDRLRVAGKRNIDYYFYSELNHSLAPQDETHFSEKVLGDMSAWLKGKL